MKIWRRVLYRIMMICSFWTLLVGCSLVGLGNDEPSAAAIKQAKQEQMAKKLFNKGMDHFNEGKFLESLDVFDRYLQMYPVGRHFQLARFYAARSLEELQRWREASERYRKVIVTLMDQDKELEARALYRLSFCYEALKRDNETIGTLLDVHSRKSYLPQEIEQAEVPARLAAAYSRVGNHEMADRYYRMAEKGLQRLHLQIDESQSPAWLSKTLYHMGYMSLRKISNEHFEEDLKPLVRSQRFLMRAIEIGDHIWAPRAAQELIGVYENIWSTIETLPVEESEDKVLSRRQRQDRQWQMAYQVLDIIKDLRLNSTPLVGNENASLVHFNEQLNQRESQLEALIVQPRVGGGLTPEAQKQESLVREGRVISPDDSLEQEAMKRMKAQKARQTRPHLQHDKSNKKEDPNL